MISQTPNLKKEQLVYLANSNQHYIGLDGANNFQHPNNSQTTTNNHRSSSNKAQKQTWGKPTKSQSGNSNLLQQQPHLMQYNMQYAAPPSNAVLNLSHHKHSVSQPQISVQKTGSNQKSFS